MRSLSQFVDIYRQLHGNNAVDKFLFALWKCSCKLLVKRGVIWQNGVNRYLGTIDKRYANNELSFKKLICVTGFGHSGSGALLDFLSEYDNVTVNAYIDGNGSLREKSGEDIEFDLVRKFGGLFTLEDAIVGGRLFDRDSVVKVFMALAAEQYNPSSKVFGENFRIATAEFLKALINCKLEHGAGYDYCPHLQGLGIDGLGILFGDDAKMGVYNLNRMTRVQYREIARAYIRRVLSAIPSNEYLVLDQPVSDTAADIRKYGDYFGEMKLVAVYRDPRDVYATAHSLNVGWIPRTVNEFIIWYRDLNNIGAYVSLKDVNYLAVRFEDLVLDYENETKRIELFMGLDASKHSKPRKAFDPSVSSRNVGLWKRLDNLKSDMSIIEDKLGKFCYTERSDV